MMVCFRFHDVALLINLFLILDLNAQYVPPSQQQQQLQPQQRYGQQTQQRYQLPQSQYQQQPQNQYQSQRYNSQNMQQPYLPGAQFSQQQLSLQQKAYQQNAISPKRASYSSGFVNTPVVTTNASSGASMQLRLVSYTNQQLSLPGGKTCICPQGQTCPFLKPGIPSCMFSFTIIVSAPDQSVQYISSEFMPVIGPTLSSGNWTTLHSLNLTSRPMAIDVFVHHLGVVIDQQTAQLEFYNYVVLVDTFVVPLANYDASQGAGTSTTVTGILQGTQLQLEYSVQCTNDKQGPSCDLTCTPASNDPNTAVCVSLSTGVVQSCQYSGVQVANCQICAYGMDGNQTTCLQQPLESQENIGVSSAYRVWTIVLGCLLGVSVLFIIMLIIFYVIARNQQLANEKERQRQSSYLPSSYASPAIQPLIRKDDEWDRGATQATTNLRSSPNDNETMSDESFARGNRTKREAQV